jgi:hypothetical protein
MYSRTGSSWTQQPKIIAPTEFGDSFDYFGSSVSIDGNLTAIGAANSAYSVAVSCPECFADLTGDGEVDFFDMSLFLTLLGNEDPIVDLTQDGEFDFFDISAFLILFNAGCP